MIFFDIACNIRYLFAECTYCSTCAFCCDIKVPSTQLSADKRRIRTPILSSPPKQRARLQSAKMPTTPINSTASYIEVEQAPNSQRQQQQARSIYGKCRIRKFLSTAAIFVALLLIVAAIYMHVIQKHHHGRLHIDLAKIEESDVSEVRLPFELVTAPAMAALGAQLLSEDCLGCIAATATGNKPAMCGEYPCSIYRISRPYWQDAMRTAQELSREDYESCVSDPDCATETVRGYIMSFARDCDGDGVIRCRDHVMLHQLGITGCRQKPLPAIFQTRLSECLRLKELE